MAFGLQEYFLFSVSPYCFYNGSKKDLLFPPMHIKFSTIIIFAESNRKIMYRSINDFLSDWKYESESTLKIFKILTDESLSKKFHEDVRTLGFLSWHITH